MLTLSSVTGNFTAGGLAGYNHRGDIELSFFGLGEQSGCSWGMMISDARLELLRGVWRQMTAVTPAILLISLALNVFGDALRDFRGHTLPFWAACRAAQ